LSLLLPTVILTVLLPQPIEHTRITGNVHVPTETILHYAAVSSEDEIPEAFRRLWDTGLFEDVRFERDEGDEGTIVIHVEEKPLLASFRFEGERLPEEDLADELGLRPRRAFGETDRRRVERLTSQFLGEGFHVRARTTTLPGDLVELVIEVERVPLPDVSKIVFTGNDSIGASELRHVMKLKPANWTTRFTGRGHASREELNADLERIRTLYRSRGYIDIAVGPAEPGAIITIPIVEGSPYALSGVDVEPGSLLDEDAVRAWLPAPGPVFDATRIDAVVGRLERTYQSRGYPGVRVARSRTVSGDAVRVTLTVDEGPFFRVGFITFRGNQRHRDRDLRQHLDIEESDRFNQSRIDGAVAALARLETVEHVVPEVDTAARPGRADVTYHVEEVDPFEYLVGGSVNGVQGGTGNGQFIAKSLLGRGDMWRLDLDLGNRFRNFAVSYRDPSTLGHRLFFTADFARANLTFPDETSEDTIDYGVRIGGPQGRQWQFLGGFRRTEFTLGTDLSEDIPFLTPFLGKRFRTNRATFTLAHEGRDRPIFATRGIAAQFGVELVTGDVEATKARAQLTAVLPLSRDRRHLLGLTGRAEAVWAFGDTTNEGLPRFERLFLGSENDLRGFAIRGVGPRENDVVVGGDRLVFATAEYQFVAHPRLRLVGFFDLGNVSATDFDGLPLPDLRYDAGGEIQFLTPIWNLPFRTGYGVNLDPVLDEDRGRFFVSLAIRF